MRRLGFFLAQLSVAQPRSVQSRIGLCDAILVLGAERIEHVLRREVLTARRLQGRQRGVGSEQGVCGDAGRQPPVAARPLQVRRIPGAARKRERLGEPVQAELFDAR